MTQKSSPADNKKPLNLIHFRTDWKGACHIIAMICEDLRPAYADSVHFQTVDFDEQNDFCKKYGIREAPTILILRNDAVIFTLVGMVSKGTLTEKIEQALIEDGPSL